MFSGDTGAVVASGDGLAASSATNALAKHAVDVVDTLQPQLFDRYAEPVDEPGRSRATASWTSSALAHAHLARV